MTPYATHGDLTAWAGTALLGDAGLTDPDALDRMLVRASEVIDDHVTAGYLLDRITGLPVDGLVAAVLRDATCAQAEFWAAVGEEHDIEGRPNGHVATGPVSVSAAMPPVLAPRALRLLRRHGLV